MYSVALNRRTITTSYQLTLDTVSWLGLSKHINAALRRVVRTDPVNTSRIEDLIRQEIFNNGGDSCHWTKFIRDLI